MTLGPRLELKQSQSLSMTPQLQQAIKLLQMSNIDVKNNEVIDADYEFDNHSEILNPSAEELKELVE